MIVRNPNETMQTLSLQLAQSILDGMMVHLGADHLVDGERVLQALSADLASGKTVRVEGVGCHACRADTVCWIERYDDPDTGEEFETMRIQTQHDSWCSYLRNRQHRVALRRSGTSSRKRARR